MTSTQQGTHISTDPSIRDVHDDRGTSIIGAGNEAADRDELSAPGTTVPVRLIDADHEGYDTEGTTTDDDIPTGAIRAQQQHDYKPDSYI